MTTADDFLEESGGDSHPAIKWTAIGEGMRGIITSRSVVKRPNLKDGALEDQLAINLDCDVVPAGETGPRTLWVGEVGFLRGAIKTAVKANGDSTKLEVGGTLAVKFTEKRDTGKPQPAHVFEAKYTPPAAGSVTEDDIF